MFQHSPTPRLPVSHVLKYSSLGYIPGASALTVVGDEVRKLRDRARAGNSQEDVVYLLDREPRLIMVCQTSSTAKSIHSLAAVMGDIGKGLYVAEDVIPIYRQLLSQATIITPNQFETDLYEALDVLHSSPHSVPHVAISSIPLPRSLVEKLGLPAPPAEYTVLLPQEGTVEQLGTLGQESLEQDPGLKQKLTDGIRDSTKQEEEPMVLACFASTKTPGSDSLQTFGFALPTVEGYFSGIGDLFSALVLGFYKANAELQPDLGLNGSGTSATNSSKPKEEQLARDYQTGDLPPFAAAVSKALLGVQQILLNTHLHTLEVASESKRRRAERQEHADCAAVMPEEEECVPSDPELDSLPPRPVSKGALPIPARTARRMRMRELRIIQEKGKILKLAEDDQVGWPASLLNWSRLLDDKVSE
ncbi:hypothetical protein QFC22_002211 [Naganishia vaughanmartiniae]|uniref:Uncharacterized protein n=1 Tax=Naganishia vaughanmartiniae TaxID=1424756 RepID=A0ACC2XFV2_9TREE|nr:hypothetical protein QFC22_002211 [Naganishia vaughanmartiniae]